MRMHQAIGIASRRADLLLTDKPFYRNQALADGIDGEEKTFESDGAEQCWTLRRNKAWSRDFIAIQSQTVLRLWARPLAVRPRSRRVLRASGFEFKPFRQRSWHHAKRSASVHKKLNFFNAPVGPVRWPFTWNSLYQKPTQKHGHCSAANKQRNNTDRGKIMNRVFQRRVLDRNSENPKSKTCIEPGRKSENPNWAGIVAIAVAFTMCGAVAQAQQPGKIHRIGVLSAGVPGSSPEIDAFRQGLRDLGYVEGKNLVIEYRYAERNVDRYPDLLSDLVRLKVDVIIGDGTGATIAAKKATSTIPIVMTSTTDPVGNGLITSLARPGGNVTGLTNISGELGGKLVELFKEIVPRAHPRGDRVPRWWTRCGEQTLCQRDRGSSTRVESTAYIPGGSGTGRLRGRRSSCDQRTG